MNSAKHDVAAITRKAAKRREARAGAYRDGVQGERCQACGSLLRDAGGAPMVYLTLEDVEAVLRGLPAVGHPGAPALRKRLEQAAGRTGAQMKADSR